MTPDPQAERIDAHQHIWDLVRTPQPWIDPEEMRPIARSFELEEARKLAAAVGVQRTVLVQTVAVPGETPLLLQQAHRDPFVAGVVGWVDLEAPHQVEDRLATLFAGTGGGRLVGIRHVVEGESDPGWLDRPTVRAALRVVAEHGLAFDLLVRAPQYPAAIRLARDLPELRLVLDHLGKPPIGSGDDGPWLHAIAALAGCANVSAKLSGLATEIPRPAWTSDDLRPYVDAALDAFGASRLAAGSDWPVCELASGYQRWWSALEELLAELSATERAAVRGGTATAAYRLQP